MELLETLFKAVGILIFYMFCFLLVGTVLSFLLLVAVIQWLTGIFGEKNSVKVDAIESPSESGPDLYIHETTILYKKEEYAVTVMYGVERHTYRGVEELDFDIHSVMGATEDFTDMLSDLEMKQLVVELEFSHVD